MTDGKSVFDMGFGWSVNFVLQSYRITVIACQIPLSTLVPPYTSGPPEGLHWTATPWRLVPLTHWVAQRGLHVVEMSSGRGYDDDDDDDDDDDEDDAFPTQPPTPHTDPTTLPHTHRHTHTHTPRHPPHTHTHTHPPTYTHLYNHTPCPPYPHTHTQYANHAPYTTNLDLITTFSAPGLQLRCLNSCDTIQHQIQQHHTTNVTFLLALCFHIQSRKLIHIQVVIWSGSGIRGLPC